MYDCRHVLLSGVIFLQFILCTLEIRVLLRIPDEICTLFSTSIAKCQVCGICGKTMLPSAGLSQCLRKIAILCIMDNCRYVPVVLRSMKSFARASYFLELLSLRTDEKRRIKIGQCTHVILLNVAY